MFVVERLEKIVKLVNENGKVEVNDLSEMFSVSKDLIRKDLAKLEKVGLLKRTYGGAIKERKTAKTVTINSRISKNVENKRKIALKALKQIKEQETIFLDISSINSILAQEILKQDLNVTIITNMINIMHTFSQYIDCKTKLISIGGICNNMIDGFVGSIPIEQIKKYNIDRCFIGTIGVNIDSGNVSTYDPDDGLTKAAIITMSKHKYLITEQTKIDQDGTFIFSNISEFDAFITDNLNQSMNKKIKKFKIEII